MRFRTVGLFLVACAAIQPAGAGAQSAPKVAAGKATIVYRNEQYGFCFVLPASWKGYTILTDQWDGIVLDSQQRVHGPYVVIRHPRWTGDNPYQGIPIMIFTPDQWHKVDDAEISVSAAPIGPSELGHNSRYVFALPPRWVGFTDDLGQQELETWMRQNRLQSPCRKTAASLGRNIP